MGARAAIKNLWWLLVLLVLSVPELAAGRIFAGLEADKYPARGILPGNQNLQPAENATLITGHAKALKTGERLRLQMAAFLPRFAGRAIHLRIQNKSPLGYLDSIARDISDPKLGQAPMARELLSLGTPLQDAYLDYAGVNPKNRLEFSRKQMNFILALLGAIKTTSNGNAVGLGLNQEYYSQLLARMKTVDSIPIASWHGEEGIGRSSYPVLIPAQLLAQGYRGKLGAAVDRIIDSADSLNAGILKIFLRPHFPFLFENAS